MVVTNLTNVKDFVLLGFQSSPQQRVLLFCLLLVVFYVTICGNLLIISLVYTSRNLHTPMYFFISQLAISDILLISEIVPNTLHILLKNRGNISYIGCMTQLSIFCALELFECLLLTVMSYDRYVAICNPLRYTSIITSEQFMRLVVSCWLLSIFTGFIDTLAALRLNFCRMNIIDHFFCDIVALEEIACSDTFPVKLQTYLIGIPFVVFPSITIVFFYGNIVRAILKISSNISRQKAFSTCSSHLTVVSIFYFSLFGVYVLPKGKQILSMSKITSLLYTVFTPLINPIIYSFRNKDIKKAIQENIKKVL